MKTTGYLVCLVIKFATGMQLRHDDLQGRGLVHGMRFHRDTPAIVNNLDGIITPYGHHYGITMPGKGLVYGVIHNLVHKVMQTIPIGGTDIHCGSFPDRFQAFKDLYITSAVILTHLFYSTRN